MTNLQKKTLLEKVKKRLDIETNINLEIKQMSRKIASFSFKTKTLRLNNKIVENSKQELINYLIFHELIHYKTNSLNHGKSFNLEMKKFFNNKEIEKFDTDIIKLCFNKPTVLLF